MFLSPSSQLLDHNFRVGEAVSVLRNPQDASEAREGALPGMGCSVCPEDHLC